MLRRQIKLVTNAGGLDPIGCARAIGELAASLGLAPKIAVVSGDNVIDQLRSGELAVIAADGHHG